MSIFKPTYIVILVAALLLACGGDDNNPQPPEAPQLVFPENNSECLEGVVSSTNPDLSTIEFRWNAASNANSYRLNIENLLTGEGFTRTTSSSSLEVELSRATPYSWYVVALSSSNDNESAQSETWKFYNAGEGITSYAPFPAELLYPRSGASLNLNGSGILELRWDGADTDNDISGYEVLLDTQSPPTTSIGSNLPSENINVTDLQASTTYYWRVITTDDDGNSSVSEVSEFYINN